MVKITFYKWLFGDYGIQFNFHSFCDFAKVAFSIYNVIKLVAIYNYSTYMMKICAKTIWLLCDVSLSSLPIFTVNAQINFHSPTQIQTQKVTHTYSANMLVLLVHVFEYLWCWQIDRGKRVQPNVYTIHYASTTHTICTPTIYHTLREFSVYKISSTQTDTHTHKHACIRTRTGIPTLIRFVYAFLLSLPISFNTTHSY